MTSAAWQGDGWESQVQVSCFSAQPWSMLLFPALSCRKEKNKTTLFGSCFKTSYKKRKKKKPILLNIILLIFGKEHVSWGDFSLAVQLWIPYSISDQMALGTLNYVFVTSPGNVWWTLAKVKTGQTLVCNLYWKFNYLWSLTAVNVTWVYWYLENTVLCLCSSRYAILLCTYT